MCLKHVFFFNISSDNKWWKTLTLPGTVKNIKNETLNRKSTILFVTTEYHLKFDILC